MVRPAQTSMVYHCRTPRLQAYDVQCFNYKISICFVVVGRIKPPERRDKRQVAKECCSYVIGAGDIAEP